MLYSFLKKTQTVIIYILVIFLMRFFYVLYKLQSTRGTEYTLALVILKEKESKMTLQTQGESFLHIQNLADQCGKPPY